MRALLSSALALILMFLSLHLHAEEPGYSLGYLDALMETRFPGFKLRARDLTPDGKVIIASNACLGPWQQRNVDSLLRETGRVTAVQWEQPAECAETSSETLKLFQANPDFRPFPEQPLFAPLIADPRQPRFSMSYQRYHISGQAFNAGSVAFGEYFGLASGFFGEPGSSQVGLQGAVFALFNLDAESRDLINADYWIGLPFSYRRGRWSHLFRVYHQSSHLGDEFLLGHPGITRVNLSYEDTEFISSYEWEQARLYGGAGYVINSEPNLDPWHARIGAEFVKPSVWRKLNFLAGLDVQASEELEWKPSRSLLAGIEFSSVGNRRLRLMAEYFVGHSPHGQFFQERLRYAGIGLYFGF